MVGQARPHFAIGHFHEEEWILCILTGVLERPCACRLIVVAILYHQWGTQAVISLFLICLSLQLDVVMADLEATWAECEFHVWCHICGHFIRFIQDEGDRYLCGW